MGTTLFRTERQRARCLLSHLATDRGGHHFFFADVAFFLAPPPFALAVLVTFVLATFDPVDPDFALEAVEVPLAVFAAAFGCVALAFALGEDFAPCDFVLT